MIYGDHVEDAIRQEERGHRRQQRHRRHERLPFAHDVLPEPELRQPLPEQADLEVDLDALREHNDVYHEDDSDECVDGTDDDPFYVYQSRRHALRPVEDGHHDEQGREARGHRQQPGARDETIHACLAGERHLTTKKIISLTIQN